MGREDEGDRLAGERYRPSWRQGNRPERQPLHHPRRRIRQDIREASSERLAASLQSAPAGQQAKAKKARKTKFTCPECGQNAWAKPDALLGSYACCRKQRSLS